MATKKGQFIKDVYEPIIKMMPPVLCDPLSAFPIFCPQEAKIEVLIASGEVNLHGLRNMGTCVFNLFAGSIEKPIYIISSMNKRFVETMCFKAV